MIQDLRNTVRRLLEQTQKVFTEREDDVDRGSRVTQVRMGFGKVRRSNAAHHQFEELFTLAPAERTELSLRRLWNQPVVPAF